MKELEEKYIELILKRCLNFEQAKSLLIQVDFKEHMTFANRVKEKANEMGIFDVCIHLTDTDELHEYLQKTPEEEISLNPLIDRTKWNDYAKKGGAILFLNSSVPGLMSDITPTKISKIVKIRQKTAVYYRENVSKYTFSWTIVALPNERWAKIVFPNDPNAYEKLYLKILEMCMVTRENPIEAWEEFIEKSNEYKRKLNELKITKLHYRNNLGTDLIVEKRSDAKWLNIDKNGTIKRRMMVNMPSYEIFSSPDYRKTEGIVYASKPLIYNGCLINNFWLRFRQGKVIDFDAKTGKETLKNLIEDHDHSCFLGEIALVEHNSPISNTGLIFHETLFDENASCHLALGDSFQTVISGGENMSPEQLDKLGLNQSKIHEDFMIGTSDLSIEAETAYGRKLIFKDGNFNI